MKKTSVITSLVATASMALPLTLVADSHEETAEAPPSLTEVWFAIPKRGMEADFNQGVAAQMALRAEGGDTRSWEAYTVAVGDHMNAVHFRACCFEWADQDTYEAAENQAEFSAHWNENVDPFVDHYHHYFERIDWENSHWPDGQGNGPYYGVTTWTVKQGSGPDSSEARKKMSQLAINDGWATDENNWLWLSTIGGKDTVTLVSSYENYAAMEPPELSFYEFAVDKLGEDDANAMFSAFNSGFSGSDYTIWVHNEKLSSVDDDE